MVSVLEALGVEATTGHWEFTLGARPHRRAVRRRGPSGLLEPGVPGRQRARHRLRRARVSTPRACSSKGGVTVAVIGQAFPYTAIANPRWMIPNWSFGIREGSRAQIRRRGARAGGAGGGAALPQRLRRRRQARLPHRGHRHHPHGPHPRRAAPAHAGRQHAARGLGLARQVPVAPRRGGGRRARARRLLWLDPGAGRRHRARSRRWPR